LWPNDVYRDEETELFLELFYSSCALIVLLPMLIYRRRSISFVLLAAVAIFVVALPWIRWNFAAGSSMRTEDQIVFTYVALLLFCFGAAAIPATSRTLGPINRRWIINSLNGGITNRRFQMLFFVFVVAWALRIYRVVKYGIMFSGSADEMAVATQDYLFVIVLSLSQMAVFGAFYYLSIHSSHRPFVIWSLIGSEVLWSLVSGGRRDLIFSLGLLFFVKLLSAQRFRIRLIVIAVALFYLVTQVLSPIFLTARINVLNYMATDNAVSAIIQGVSDSVTEMVRGETSSLAVLSENLTARGDVGGFLTSVVTAASSSGNFMHGTAIGTAFAWSVPSAIMTKPNLMVEQYIQSQLSLPMVDDAVSWIAVGYADFGMFGCFVYGAVFILILMGLLAFGRRSRSEFLYVIAGVQVCYIAYNVEADPMTLFCSVRDFTILFALYKTCLFAQRLSSARR
jgi:hypothetical protein